MSAALPDIYVKGWTYAKTILAQSCAVHIRFGGLDAHRLYSGFRADRSFQRRAGRFTDGDCILTDNGSDKRSSMSRGAGGGAGGGIMNVGKDDEPGVARHSLQ